MVWSVLGLTWITRRVASRPAVPVNSPAFGWRLSTEPVRLWSDFLDAVDRRVPLGDVVVIAGSSSMTAEDEFFLSMWCAYYLPRHQVVRRRELLQVRTKLGWRDRYWLVAQDLSGVDASPYPGEVLLEGPAVLLLVPDQTPLWTLPALAEARDATRAPEPNPVPALPPAAVPGNRDV